MTSRTISATALVSRLYNLYNSGVRLSTRRPFDPHDINHAIRSLPYNWRIDSLKRDDDGNWKVIIRRKLTTECIIVVGSNITEAIYGASCLARGISIGN